MKNYGLSVLPAPPFHVFVLWTLLGGIPWALGYVVMGSAARDLAAAAAGETEGAGNTKIILSAIAIPFTIASFLAIGWYGKQELDEVMAKAEAAQTAAQLQPPDKHQQ